MVHSISYGGKNNDYNNITVQRLDYELQKMAVRGITVIVASGNEGVNCKEPRIQQPLFPTSPYMTLGLTIIIFATIISFLIITSTLLIFSGCHLL